MKNRFQTIRPNNLVNLVLWDWTKEIPLEAKNALALFGVTEFKYKTTEIGYETTLIGVKVTDIQTVIDIFQKRYATQK